MPDRYPSNAFDRWTIGDDQQSLHHETGVVIRLREAALDARELPIAGIDLPRACQPGPDRILAYINSAHRFWRKYHRR